MSQPDEPVTGLPDVLRNSNRPIVIYQGAPPASDLAQMNNALGVLFWLALVTVCLAVAGGYAWRVWNAGYDQDQFSPVYAEGRPAGLVKQLEERRQINAWAEGLIEFRDDVRADNAANRTTTASHALLTDRGGVDTLRRRWDAMCNEISTRIYDRRVGAMDARVVALRRQRSLETDPAQRLLVDSELARVRQERDDEIARRRANSDPSLRCTPATEAALCSDSDGHPWCNPQLSRPGDFTDREP